MSSDDNTPTQPKGTQPELAALLASAGKRSGGRRWVWRGAALALVVAAGAAYFVFGGGDTVYNYTTVAAKKGDLTVLVTATGSIEPTVQVVVSSEQSGTIREVFVDYNSTVRKGEVVARLDTAKLEADVKSAEAKLLSAKAAVSKAIADMNSAQVTLERLTTLVSNRVSSQQDLDAARYAYDAAVATKESAEAEVLSAEASLQQARLNLSKADIVSPIDGIVLSRDVDPGATVAASLSAPTLFTIAGDLKEMELQVAIDEADVGQVEVGQRATFTVDAFPDERFPAEITSIRYASVTENNVVTYKGILSVDNSSLKLRQGMTATADIVVQSIEGGLLVPNAALRYSPALESAEPRARRRSGIFNLFRPPRMGALTAPEPAGTERTVWVLRNGVPNAVNIEIGASDGQNTVVTKGEIAEGDQVIIDETARSQ
jgi:RND family efflux transporter, MFP subunit